jgi:hypothetical protein
MSIQTAFTFASVLHRLFCRFTGLRLPVAGSALSQRSLLRLPLAWVRRGVVHELWHTWLAMRLTLRSSRPPTAAA